MDQKNYYKVGSHVSWKWLGKSIKGKVKEVFFKPVVKTIKNKKIKRNGSDTNPAYLVESEAQNLALKLHSELSSIHLVNKKSSPKMFAD